MAVRSNIEFNTSFNLDQVAYSLTGYRFIGWSETPLTALEAEAIEKDPSRRSEYYTDKEQVAFTVEDVDSMTLYAMWGRNKYKLTFEQNETVGNIPDPYKGTYDVYFDQVLSDNPAFAPKTRTNYTFTGKWTTMQIAEPYARKTYNGTDYITDATVY